MSLMHLLHDTVKSVAEQELYDFLGDAYKKLTVTDIVARVDETDLYEGKPLTKIVTYLKGNKDQFTQAELNKLDELFPPEKGESPISQDDEISVSHEFPLVHEVIEEEFEEDEEEDLAS